jgi:hypothetical protein
MPRKEILDRTRNVAPYRITRGERFALNNCDPGDTCGLTDKREASKLLRQGTDWLAQEQQMLYARDRWSLLLVFQAMDAAGKDSTIKHVMSGVNPQGCQVFSFKQPSQEDLSHDFMWRYFKCLTSDPSARYRASLHAERRVVRALLEMLGDVVDPVVIDIGGADRIVREVAVDGPDAKHGVFVVVAQRAPVH